MPRGSKSLTSRPHAYIVLLLTALIAASALSCNASTSSTASSERTTSPFNGMPLADSSSAQRRALAVKVENYPDARPQSGLTHAELVYEELVEGGITRFVALYLDEDVPKIGPVRSARPMDINLLEDIDPLFAISGGSPEVMQLVEASSLDYIQESVAATKKYFYRTRDRRAPHNLYTSTDLLRAYCTEAGLEGREWKGDLFHFGEAGESDACTAIKVKYPANCAVSYAYDTSTGKYLRSVAGSPHLDKESGEQVAPTTMIIQYVELIDTGIKDVAGELSPDADLGGSGDALVFTDGKVFPAAWEKSSSSDRTIFLSPDGEEITIAPGQVWVHLIPVSISVEY